MHAAPAALDLDALSELLARAWQLPPADLRYAPVGFGSHHWVATTADGRRRFVTLDDLGDDAVARRRLRAALTGASLLHERAGLEFVVAPQPAVDGEVVRTLPGGYAVAVYPLLSGGDVADHGPATDPQRAEVVATLARLHAATDCVRGIIGAAGLRLPGRAGLTDALARRHEAWPTGPYGESARRLLHAGADRLHALLARYDELAAAVDPNGWVVTHGEPKPGNLLVTDDGLRMVDWDTVLLAPAARDLWLADDGSGTQVAAYTRATGRRVPGTELEFYRLRWDLCDIAEFVGWFAAPHARTADTEIAWRALSELLSAARPGAR